MVTWLLVGGLLIVGFGLVLGLALARAAGLGDDQLEREAERLALEHARERIAPSSQDPPAEGYGRRAAAG